MESPEGFDQFVAAVSEPIHGTQLPGTAPPDAERITQLAAAYGIRILRQRPKIAKRDVSQRPGHIGGTSHRDLRETDENRCDLSRRSGLM